MALTAQELSTLKADMLGASNGALAAMIAANDTHGIKDYYNAASATKLWMADASVDAVLRAVQWKNYTPSDPVPTDTALNVAIFQTRLDMLRLQQANLVALLSIGRAGTLPGHDSSWRQGVQDACAQLPSGTAGASRNGGWTGNPSPIQTALQRLGTRFEVLFSSVDGAANNSTRYGYTVTALDIREALVA